MRKVSIFLILLTAILSLIGCSRTPSKRQIVEAYRLALKSGNIDSLMTFYTPETRVEYVGMAPPLWGKEALRGRAEYDSALHTYYTIHVAEIKRDTVFVKVMENNDWLSKAGLPINEYSTFYFIISSGKITYIHAELSDASINRLNTVMSALIPWAEQNRPDEFNRLTSQLYMFSAESARLSLELLEAWKKTQSQ